MSQATQLPLLVGNGSEQTDNGFYDALNFIRQNANTQFGKGRLFERLIRAYLLEDPFYNKRFSEVYLWAEWAENQPGFTRTDLGIDLVAVETTGGICAIQCKCYAEDKRVSPSDIDSFITYSNRQPFTARIFVDTGKSWTANLIKKIDGLEPPCQRISAADLASRPVAWPDLSLQEPDQLNYQLETFSLREHQQNAYDDVINGFKESDRGKMIMACGTGKTFTALRIPDRIDNISDTVLKAFQEHYSDDTITKDDIFYYVYGILHASNYRDQFANDLSKMLPRIPYAPDFTAFAEAGYKLAELHLNYETCEQYPLTVEFPNMSSQPANLKEVDANLFLLTEKAMRYGDIERRSLNINDHVRLTGIPEDAHRYVVNGRSPLAWFIDRYKIKTDTDSGIVNDPNGWFEDPRDLVTAIKRIVYVSVESARIIDGLPEEIIGE